VERRIEAGHLRNLPSLGGDRFYNFDFGRQMQGR